MVTFSVIIPTYNRATLIGNAVQSVINQTFSDWELIVVDDGSVDNTKEVIDTFINTDKRIKYCYKENGGQNSALNCGLAYAKGKYVAFLDSDDIWTKDKLQKVYEKYLEDKDVACVYHRTGKMSTGGKVANNEDYLEGYIYKEVLTQEFMSAQISLSCKRDCFLKTGQYDEQFRCFQDDDMCFQLAKNFKIGIVKEVLSLVGDLADIRVTDNATVRAIDYMKLLKKYKKDICRLCGIEEMSKKYSKAMTLYCRAKMWKEASSAKRYALKTTNILRRRIKIDLIFFYEMLKSVSGYTTFAVWYNKKKCTWKFKQNTKN